MKEIAVLLQKELKIEWRTGQFAALILCLSVLVSILAGIGLTSTFLDPPNLRRLFPVILWLVFIFSATVAMSRSFDYELLDRGIEGFILLGVPPWKIFIAKFLVTLGLSFVGVAVSFVIVGSFCSVPVGGLLMRFFVPALLVSIGYGALSTLLAAVASSSQLRGLLLPLILLPLLFPLFFGAIELTAITVSRGAFIESSWLSLLIGLDVVYLALGINLYEYVIRD
jgi:heme exporter protein B